MEKEKRGHRWHALQERFVSDEIQEVRVLVHPALADTYRVPVSVQGQLRDRPNQYVVLRATEVSSLDLFDRFMEIRASTPLSREAALIEAAIPYLMD